MGVQCPKCQYENPDDTAFCGKCGTKFDADIGPTKTLETPTEELTRGSTFAERYEIIEELGKGGMGRVYRVEDTKVKQEIALKLIKPEIASDKKTIERFKNELKTARNIRHKNICGMFDLGEEKGRHYITMEYVSGGDLKRFIRRAKRLDAGTAISIAKQICEGLEEAHGLGIVHRDLKPSNIMIDDNGNARIMDFGIARPIEGKGITGSGVMIGTPEYMSPEQVEVKDIDHRSDIYSLGIILYEMTTGNLPFEAEQAVALSQESVQKEWESDWHWALATVYRRSKKYEEALKEWDKAINTAVEVEDLHQQRRALHGKGLTYIDMGSMDLAEKTATELKKLTETGMNTKHMRFYHHLMGNIELEKNNFPRAIDYFERAVSLLPHEYNEWHLQALFYDSLAFAYFQARDLEKALENYEKITSMTTGRFYLNDIYAKSFYMLGKIHEQQDNRSKAIEYYEKFLDLWKNADPGTDEVSDAKKRLGTKNIGISFFCLPQNP